ncbi:biotin transporter BioY [Aquibacillus salsiterrae]|uniref:Biotin transporter n=1 Tax=Aquibacillus salsiterrae TaxID=2950439 RepID=A0A9X3WEF3_9BACI|nr:biotin transporter BioY [Aquibacillus salsiterrae]MDC3415904.1 biotin transporter BioY [Aquibacillus salsiterrae]
MKFRAIDLTMSAMFAALMAIGSNITSFLIVGGVPITLTTFFSILAGLLLGSRLGAVSMTVYALIGLAGAPVFANFSGGLSVMVSPTFGFILSYILVAFVVGKIAENRSSRTSFIFAAIVGLIINYGFGTNWMYFAYKWLASTDAISYKLAWTWMIVPLPKDIILTISAGVLALRLRKNIHKITNVFDKETIA